MARSYTVEADGRTIPFEAPDDATQEQLRALAARALAKAVPNRRFAKPVLERRLRENMWRPSGELKAEPATLAGNISNRIDSALSAFGVDERESRRLANKATGALTDLTPVGSAVEADMARQRFGEGDYLGALGHGALAAFSAVPDAGPVAKAMFLGALSRTADTAALKRAAAMEEGNTSREAIWNETGWFRGADNRWRYEVPDDNFLVNKNRLTENLPNPDAEFERFASPYYDLPYGDPVRRAGLSRAKDAKDMAFNARMPAPGVVDHPEVMEAYPGLRNFDVGRTRDPADYGSWSNQSRLMRLDLNRPAAAVRSTAAHELQHAVQDFEGFARGGMVGTIPAHQVSPELERLQQELADALEEKALRADIRDPVTNRIQDEPAWHAVSRRAEELQQKIAKLRPSAEYEGYRRLAGEVEARNVQTRLDFSPELRRLRPPWTTEDVPREDQFVLWYGK